MLFGRVLTACGLYFAVSILEVFRPSMTATKAVDLYHKMVNKPDIYACFEAVNATWRYLFTDLETLDVVAIDSVSDFNPVSSQISTNTADGLLGLISKYNLTVTQILETPSNAEHLAAATYLEQKLVGQGSPRPEINIGVRNTDVEPTRDSKYQINASNLADVFHKLFQDNEEFIMGELCIKISFPRSHP